ncbi:MAG: aminotransferase class I/II-fold pyridoxal phosphate-dependent enzyme [Candidatus Dojkabacteria bacterium]|jgi:aspartate/methionine/tyrosine aminotransferase|nr:aminotransferase class I/II-fold pyridoxal phosphate-dependent enzyme [Candidatus Dojkabacteria bacterium]
MNKEDLQYLKEVYENNFEVGSGDKKIDEETYEVDKAYDSSGIIFLSEWFFDEKVHQYTGIDKDFFNVPFEIPTQYYFPDSYQKLNKDIENFHRESEGYYEDGEEIFITEGSTPMIASLLIFAKSLGFDRIYSVSPLYFNIFKVAELIDMPISPINSTLTHDNADINLSDKKSFLIITNPIWSIGRHQSEDVFEKLAEWQKSTKSLIFVDGSFSYTDWYSREKKEPERILDPTLTFRLICPTKTLGLNGLRFSYLICPSEYKKELSRITCSTIGSSSYFSHKSRPAMFEKMIADEINPIGAFSRDRFLELKELFESNDIEYINPTCGFFMFANLENYFERKGLLDKYMWIPNSGLDIFDEKYSGCVKLNLIMREKSFSKFKKDLSQ